MPKTILEQYEEWLDEREQRGEIASRTRNTYLNDASRIFEVILRNMPPQAIEECLRSEGYKGQYNHVIEALRSMARGHREVGFGDPRQGRLPGV